MGLFKKAALLAYGWYATVVVVVCMLVAGVLVLVVPGLDRRRRIARRGLRILFFCARIPFHVTGLERLPAQPCVVIANHRGYLDGLVLIAALPPYFAPVIKAEVDKLPVVGRVLRRVGARYVQRTPAVRAGTDARALLDALQGGESLALFPEGTFSLDDGLLPFREGAFFLAATAGSAIVPVAIRGSRNALPPGQVLLRPAAVTVEFMTPLYADRQERAADRALRDRAEEELWHGLKPRAPAWAGADHDHYSAALSDQVLPLAWLDLDRLEDNLHAVLQRTRGKWLRVDATVLRCPAVLDRVLRSDVRLRGVRCASASEADYLAREWGMTDILVACPTLQHRPIEQVCSAVAEGCDITMAVDSPVHLTRLAEVAGRFAVQLSVCIGVDLSVDRQNRRSPLCTAASVLALLADLAERPQLRLRGLFAVAGTPGLRARLDEQLVARGWTDVEWFADTDNGVLDDGAAGAGLTEITIGKALFGAGDTATDGRHPPVIGLAMEVVSRPQRDLYLCLGGDASAGATADRPVPFLPPDAVLEHSWVDDLHVPIRYAGELRLGDAVFLRAPDAADLCARFDSLLLMQGGTVVDVATTYRAFGGPAPPAD